MTQKLGDGRAERLRPAWPGLVALVALLAANGCGAPKIVRAYPGPERPSSELALIKGADRGTVAQEGLIFIAVVDGVRVDHGHWVWDRLGGVMVEPGVHVVEVAMKRGTGNSVALLPLRFAVEAGGEYEIHGAELVETFGGELKKAFTGSGRWQAWAIDVRTGAVIAGVKPEQ
jgi:hypothetical protein